jgi:hypothetical protein
LRKQNEIHIKIKIRMKLLILKKVHDLLYPNGDIRTIILCLFSVS